MPREVVNIGCIQLDTAPDTRPPIANCLCAIAEGQVVDEVTQAEVTAPVCGSTSLQPAMFSALYDGFFAVAGVPLKSMPALATQSYNFTISVSAAGYLPQTISTSIGPIPGFPQSFAPVVLPTITLHRKPVQVYGRVVNRSGGATTPIAGASVQVTSMWRILPSPGGAPVAETPNIVAVQPPLGLLRTAGVDTLLEQTWTPVVGGSKSIVLQALTGTVQLMLSDAVGIAAGTLLLLDGADPATAEVVTVATPPLTALANQPAFLTLAAPLILTHNDGGTAQIVTVSAPGPANSFAQNGLPGDVVVFLNGLNGLASADTAEIAGAPAEYHTTSLFNVTTDAAGYYRLPPISRVYQIALTAENGLGGTQTQNIWPDYTECDNQYDFVFRS